LFILFLYFLSTHAKEKVHMPKQSSKRRTSAHDDYPKYLSIETLHSAHRSKDAKHTRGIPTTQSIHRYERAKIVGVNIKR
jgi:hypothetical protein